MTPQHYQTDTTVCLIINHCDVVAITWSRILLCQLKSEISERYLRFIFADASGTLLHITVTCPVQSNEFDAYDLLAAFFIYEENSGVIGVL